MIAETPPAKPSDPDHQMQWDIHLVAVLQLRAALPPPIEDTPEAWIRRDRVALAKVASLVVGNPVEADFAALCVATTAHAFDCLRQVGDYADDVRRAMQLRAQAASLGREARGFCGQVLRLQKVREKREATDEGRDSALWSEHCLLGLMLQVLESLPALPTLAEAAAAKAAAAETAAAETAAAEAAAAEAAAKAAAAEAAAAKAAVPAVAAAAPISPEEWKLRWEADVFAIVHTQQSRLIRRLGGLPAGCGVENPEPRMLQAILAGNGSNQQWADEMTIEEARMNAGLDLPLCRYDVEGDTAIGVYVAGAADAAGAVIPADTAIPAGTAIPT